MSLKPPRLAISRTGAIALGTLCALAIAASPAAANTVRLFAKTTQSTFTDPSGHPILGHVPPPPPGSVLTNTGVEYRGTFKQHASTTSASTNIVCFVTKAPKAVCYAQIAIDGSMLLANRFTANLAQGDPFASIPINGGTGRFAGVHGTVRTTSVGSGQSIDLTITYQPPHHARD